MTFNTYTIGYFNNGISSKNIPNWEKIQTIRVNTAEKTIDSATRSYLPFTDLDDSESDYRIVSALSKCGEDNRYTETPDQIFTAIAHYAIADLGKNFLNEFNFVKLPFFLSLLSSSVLDKFKCALWDAIQPTCDHVDDTFYDYFPKKLNFSETEEQRINKNRLRRNFIEQKFMSGCSPVALYKSAYSFYANKSDCESMNIYDISEWNCWNFTKTNFLESGIIKDHEHYACYDINKDKIYDGADVFKRNERGKDFYVSKYGECSEFVF